MAKPSGEGDMGVPRPAGIVDDGAVSTAEGTNLALRFFLEMATLAALAFWGFTLDADIAIRIAAGFIAPALAVLVWGTFIAPRARMRLEDPARLIVELLYFASGVVALALAGLAAIAVAFAIAVGAHVYLMLALKQR